MGLGKTLTMLAAILSTLPQAEEFGSFYEFEPEPNSFIRTKATLVVVSSARGLFSAPVAAIVLPLTP